jgi:hypothetical protein
MRSLQVSLLASALLVVSTSSGAFAAGAATPTDRGADISVNQSHGEASVGISASVGASGRSGTGTVSSGQADVSPVGPRDK